MTTPSPWRRWLPLAVLGAAAIALGLWLTVLQPSSPPRAPTPPTSAGPGPNALSDLPPELRTPGDAPTAAVRLILDVAGRDRAGLLALVLKLPARPLPGDAPEAPRAVSTLADALAGNRPLQATPVSSFERALLYASLGRALDLTPRYAYQRGTRHAASELLARPFAVRFADDEPWRVMPATSRDLDRTEAELTVPDGDPSIVPLKGPQLEAMHLAFVAMGRAAAADYEEARRLTERAARVLPDDPALMFLLGRLELATGKEPVARRLFERAASRETDAMTHFLLGRLGRVEGRPLDALKAFRDAAAEDPTFGEPHVELAELTLDRLDLTPKSEHPEVLAEARSHIAAAREADPNAQGLGLVHAHLVALGADAEDPDPSDESEAARDGRHRRAIALIEGETERNPHLEAAWMLLAQVHAAREDDDAAIAALQRAHAIGRETGETANALGQLLAATGRFEEALTAFDRALRLAPHLPELRPQIAQIRRQRGDMDLARRAMQAQLERFPTDRTSLLLLAQLELDDKRPAAAGPLIERALGEDPDDAEALVLRAIAAVVAETDPTPHLPRALEAAGGHRRLAEILLSQGLHAAALPILEAGLEAEADDLLVPVMIVALYTVNGRLEEAARLRDATLSPLDPEDRAELDALFDEGIAEAMRARAEASDGGRP